MSELTAAERKWIKKLQKVIDECPSERLGFYTIGDNNICMYDAEKYDELDLGNIDDDLVFVVRAYDLDFDTYINFPNNVEGACG